VPSLWLWQPSAHVSFQELDFRCWGEGGGTNIDFVLYEQDVSISYQHLHIITKNIQYTKYTPQHVQYYTLYSSATSIHGIKPIMPHNNIYHRFYKQFAETAYQ
jgi:hypothetical protein